MTDPIRPPAPKPCVSCPYRRDVPSGLWDESEYAKLVAYDAETGTQPPAVFLCHQQDGRACAGWAATHDLDESLGLRLAILEGVVRPEDVDAFLDYVTVIPTFGSGSEAALHGLRDVQEPSPEARAMIDRLTRKLWRG